MVLWLKTKAAADWLLQTRQALFGGGAYAAFCTRYLQDTSSKVCYSCKAYGYTQTVCRRTTRCGNCSGSHQTRDCTGTTPLKCPACMGAHTVKDWCYKHHLAHKKYLAQMSRMPEALQTVEPARGLVNATKTQRWAALEMSKRSKNSIYCIILQAGANRFNGVFSTIRYGFA